jgi:rhamnose utilization protein RhaD (predicted bifunctional aldolase and dehydrogenase)
MTTDRQQEIVALSRMIAEPERDLVILAEGNTSMRTAPDRMLVKTTGSTMATAGPADFVEVDLTRFWELIDAEGPVDDAAVATLLRDATMRGAGRPSVESLLHAVCQRQDGVDTVIHTHPVPVNAILCSDRAELLVAGALFPDQIVVLGRHPMLVPYVDPGLPLAREVDRRLRGHVARFGEAPRAIFLRNHGMFALGASPRQAVHATQMAVKVARVLLGAASAGEPRFLSDEHADRIDTRPDELLRRLLLMATTQDSRDDGLSEDRPSDEGAS